MGPSGLPGNVVASYFFIIYHQFKLYIFFKYFPLFKSYGLLTNASINISDKKYYHLNVCEM